MKYETQFQDCIDEELIEHLQNHADLAVRALLNRFQDLLGSEEREREAEQEGYDRGWKECAAEYANRLSRDVERLQLLAEELSGAATDGKAP